MLGQTISRNSLILGVFALATVGVVATTYLQTKPRIIDAERRVKEAALLEIIPRDSHDNDMLTDTLAIEDLASLSLKEPEELFVAKQDGKVVGVIIPSQALDSYSGTPIKLITGIRTDGSIYGVRVLTHKETPGLGDKIELKKHPWVLDFSGKSLLSPNGDGWNVKKDGGEFDQFTGATITPRAVVHSVHKALQYFDKYRTAILEPAPQNTGTPAKEPGNG